MAQRLFFAIVTVFFVTMNVLLWRSEFGGVSALNSSVPVEMVWEKILTAPDDSSLEIYHQGKKIGFCRWATLVGEEYLAEEDVNSEPEGMVGKISGYRIDFNGNVALKDMPARLKFHLDASFETNHIWQELNLSLGIRPLVWEVFARAKDRTVRVRTGDESGEKERVFSFSALRDPESLFQEMESPLPIPFLGALPKGSGETKLDLGLKWKARNEWFKIARTSVRAYLLETQILERYKIKIFVSRVGEILRVELPNEIVLVNDQLTTL